MLPIDVDDIVEVNYAAGGDCAEVTFKDGVTRIFEGDELLDILSLLNHWTPPTA